ncbi:hypothetical protein PF011_g2291 [Phytophthora fragariae]|uniref:Uncharacterized protein n=1 Tax=Phytophthora fragariae TaxID=53985 RepID=A0A6A3MEI3_9STRA|nr:hypothetical protein PF011_g2291 [Phytophthora fragariae]
MQAKSCDQELKSIFSAYADRLCASVRLVLSARRAARCKTHTLTCARAVHFVELWCRNIRIQLRRTRQLRGYKKCRQLWRHRQGLQAVRTLE